MQKIPVLAKACETGASLGRNGKYVNEKRGLFREMIFTPLSIHDKKDRNFKGLV
jgi:hypothetical protein